MAHHHAALSVALDALRWSIEATYHACHTDDRPLLADANRESPLWQTRAPEADNEPERRLSRLVGYRHHRSSGEAENAAAELKTPREPSLDNSP